MGSGCWLSIVIRDSLKTSGRPLPWCRALVGVYIALFSEIQFRFSLNITSSYVKKQHLG